MTAHCLVIVEHRAIVVFLAVTRLPHPVLFFFCGARDEPYFLLYYYSLRFCSKFVLEVYSFFFFLFFFVIRLKTAVCK